jgi:iron(III) transport system ATP-binding protein
VLNATAGTIEVTDLHKRFGRQLVLRSIDLHVAPRTVVALLGPSGCGKTTLLRTIAGLERPDQGTIEVSGEQVVGPDVNLPPERRRIGMVFQDWALFPHLDVAGNIAFGLPREERGANQGGDRIAEMLDLVELPADFRTRRPDELSGGQQQRVALARSLAPNPAVVLLDEPFSSLDASLRGTTARAVRRALAATNTTALLVTHDQNEALSLGDQVAVMRAGRLVQSAPPSEVYLAPHDPQVAEFVGRAVVLAATAHGPYAECALGPVSLLKAAHGPVALVIRPEQLQINHGPGEGFPNDGVRGTVDEVSYYGHDSAVQVTLDDGTSVLARIPGAVGTGPGDVVHVIVTGGVRAFPPGETP